MERPDIAMRLVGLAGAAVLLAAFFSAARADAAEQPLAKNMRILFIGNSFTYANDLPGMLIGMMATKGISLETRSVTPGGCTLKKHWDDGNAVKAIREGGWNYVVIQEQSQMPVLHPAETLKYAALLVGEARKVGAEPVFYMTWAYKADPNMQPGLAATYTKAAKDANCLLAPVGLAWRRALKEDPKLVLHAKDGKHPSPQGTYLAASVFYATLLRRDPAGLPGRLVIDTPVRPNVIQRRTPCNLTTAQVQPLQTVAWKIVEEFQSYRPAGEPREKADDQKGTGNRE